MEINPKKTKMSRTRDLISLAVSGFIIVAMLSCSNKDDLGDDAANSFIKYYGNTDPDEGFEVLQTPEGGYALFGTRTNAGSGSDLALIKTDEFGNLQWEKYYGGSLDDIGRGFDILPNGGYVMTGTYMNNPDVSDPLANSLDAYVVWVDEQGNSPIEIQIDFRGNNPGSVSTNDEGYAIVADKINNTDNVFMIGYCTARRENANTGSGAQSNVLGKKDVLLARLNPSGVIFQNAFGYEEDDQGFDAFQAPIGSSNEGDYLFTGYVEFQEPNSNQFTQQVLLGIYPSDGLDNLSTFGFRIKQGFTASLNQGTSLHMISDDELYITGWSGNTSSSDIFLLAGPLAGFLSDNIEVTPLTEGGLNKGYGMDYIGNGELVIAGNTSVASIVQGGSDHYLLKVNAQGEVDWAKTYGGTGDESANSVIVTGDRGYGIVGVSDFESNALVHFIKTDGQGVVGN